MHVSPASSIRTRAVRAVGSLLLAASLLASSGCSLIGLDKDEPPVAAGAGSTNTSGSPAATATPDATKSVEPSGTAKPAAKPKAKPKPGKAAGVSYDGAKRLIRDGVFFIDIRPRSEFELAHAKGAKNVPVEKIIRESRKWEKDAAILMYSTHDAVSRSVARYLARRGYERVYYLKGGSNAWKGNIAGDLVDLDLAVKDPEKPTVHYYYITGEPNWVKAKPTVEKWRKDYKGKVVFKGHEVASIPMVPVDVAEDFGLLFIVQNTDGDWRGMIGDASVVIPIWAYINSAVKGEERFPMNLYSKETSNW